MKKLLIIILTLFSLHSFAQDTTYVKVRGIPGAYNFSKSGDSLIFYVAGVRQALSVGSTVDLSNYYNKTQVDNSLNGKLDTSYKQSITAIKPLHWNIITKDSATIGLYIDTTSTLSDGSDTTVPSTKAIKKYIDSDSLGWLIATKYGAVGDSATDNTVAIQALFNAVPASGGTVYFPHGVYLISDSIIIPRKCRIIGDGHGVTYSQLTKNYSSSGSMIVQVGTNKTAFFVNGRGVSFEFLGIKNNVDNPTSSAGIRFHEGREFYLNKVRIENFYINLDIMNGDLWSIDHSYFQDAVLYNVQIADSSSNDAGDASITSSWFFGGKYQGTTNIRFRSGGGLKVVNCKIHGSASTPYSRAPLYGFDATDAASTSVLLFTNNSFEYYRGSAIKISNAANKFFGKIIVSGNQFLPGGSIPIHSVDMQETSPGDLSNVIIVNNIIDISNDSLSAIYLEKINSGILFGNVYTAGFSNTDSVVNCTNFITPSNFIGSTSNNADSLGGLPAAAYATLNSPTFTNTVNLPTGAIGVTQADADNSTKLSTTAFVQNNAYTYKGSLANGSDLDAVTSLGVYHCSAATSSLIHSPSTYTSGSVILRVDATTSYVFQTILILSNNRMYYRLRTASTWGSWSEMITDSRLISGTATLSSGTITVYDTRVKTGAKISVSVNTPSGTQGFLSAPVASIVNNASFVINSTSATENSTVTYNIVNP